LIALKALFKRNRPNVKIYEAGFYFFNYLKMIALKALFKRNRPNVKIYEAGFYFFNYLKT